ncbi:MAG: ester cyclase [Amaricoccus sp.]|uniref:ester cyclase n=1 Tax=Amaricoccus sp. TaxID=1872485 RepID=UPI0039E288D2
MPTNHLETKHWLHAGLARLAEAGPGGAAAVLANLYAPDAEWRGAHPLNEMRGAEAIAAAVWEPLFAACPDLERRDLIVAAGTFEGRDYVAAVGHYCGVFHADWLGIPATGRTVYLRYGEVHEVRGGRIVQSSCLWDILDLIRQAGLWPLPPSLGAEGMWPGPITGEGLRLAPANSAQSAASLAQTLAMQGTLGAFRDHEDAGREELLAMPQRAHWHERMMWYGPAGIGTTRGLPGFVDQHQLPFRIAFPNRKGGQHYIRIGDGPISVTGGWPSVTATHTGGGFLGLGPTGRLVGMRVMDFYLHHEGLIRENWVPLDILDLLMQLGVDVLARLRDLRRR